MAKSVELVESSSTFLLRMGGSSPPAPSVGSIESFTLEPDLQLQAKSDRIVRGVLWTLYHHPVENLRPASYRDR